MMDLRKAMIHPQSYDCCFPCTSVIVFQTLGTWFRFNDCLQLPVTTICNFFDVFHHHKIESDHMVTYLTTTITDDEKFQT